MICYHRKLAFLVPCGENRGMYFGKRPRGLSLEVYVPCGKCRACRVNKANEWALRCYHEMHYVHDSCFLTLTYSDEFLPANHSLLKSDVQKFLKRLRKKHTIRSYMAVGEYGSRLHRPHYHLCIFGWKPSHPIFWKRSKSGVDMYNDDELSRLWPFGWAVVEDCNAISAAYLARYSKKMVMSDDENAEPSFSLASRNIRLTNGEHGALGSQFLFDYAKYNGINIPYFSVGDKKFPFPRYYLKKLQEWFPAQFDIVKALKRQYLENSDDGYVLAYIGETREAVRIDGKMLDADECAYWTKRLLEAEEVQEKSLSRLTRPLEV